MSFRLSMRGTRPAQAHKPAGVLAAPASGRNSIRSVVVPADGTSAATVGNGDFGTSPFFGQFSGKQLPARIWHVGCRR
jgi:hypothetical protein